MRRSACARASRSPTWRTAAGTPISRTSIVTFANWWAARRGSSHSSKTCSWRREILVRMKLYPSLRYKDAKAAHQWLQDAFGLEPNALYEDDDGNVAHAQMRWGSDMIMF